MPGDLRLGALVQAHDAEAGDALPGTRLADYAQGAASLDAERDAVHCLYQAVLGREVDVQVLDLEESVRHQYLTLGSSTA